MSKDIYCKRTLKDYSKSKNIDIYMNMNSIPIIILTFAIFLLLFFILLIVIIFYIIFKSIIESFNNPVQSIQDDNSNPFSINNDTNYTYVLISSFIVFVFGLIMFFVSKYVLLRLKKKNYDENCEDFVLEYMNTYPV